MKVHNRIISTFLAVIIMLGSLASFGVVSASAAATKVDDVHAHFLSQKFKTPEEKLAAMEKRLEYGDYALYVDVISGEIALQNVKTNDILFSNPYDASSSGASTDPSSGRFNELMSQIIIRYTGGAAADTTLYSFRDAAMKGQISVLNIKNGLRVEYTIGQDSVKRLVPKQIPAESFEMLIDVPLREAVQAWKDSGKDPQVGITEFEYEQFVRFYSKKSLTGLSGYEREMTLEKYPVCAEMDIYVIKEEDNPIATYNKIENLLKEHCKKYTFDQMDADHDAAGYVASDEKFPVFKLALEYYLDDTGLRVVMPCNGLRYDMSSYKLESISILPYMGAGNHTNDGYNFFPDGSGSLINFKQLNANDTFSIRGKIYGIDYAYQDLSTIERRDIRYPVYGTVATETIYTFSFRTTYELDENCNLVLHEGKEKDTGNLQTYTVTISNTVLAKNDIAQYVADRHGTLVVPDGATSGISEKTYKRGYVAVIEAGESLADLEAYQGGNTVRYNTIKNYFNPMPSDTCYLLDALTGKWQEIPQSSETKYTGSIQIHYQMLTDPEKEITLNGTTTKVKNSGLPYYETTWFGMAEAYRDSLVANGTLKKLTTSDLEEDIPLYVEVFGTLETQQTIMTIPVSVMTPLTTFENVYDMYDELSAANVNNINFKLTGFANGGMYSTVPAALDWEDAVGGKEGFKELLEKAAAINTSADKNMGIFPDFDFAYIQEDTWFDSTSLKEDALKTMDNRYSSKRQYSATQQTYITFYQLAMSPSRYSKFYNELLENLKEYDLNTISIGSLGHSLNSDFDEEDPYNREESKDYTAQAFRDMKNAGYSLMTESANAYTWAYVDHIINLNLDSSRHNRSSASVPFIGVVLHGYVQFAGAPLNEEGDINYAMLRAIENGAGLYFILSYQNTQELKKDPILSQYYSIRYDIWKEDVIKYYNELNEVLGDVQDKVIISHEFLTGNRVLDMDELEEELNNQKENAAKEEQEKQDQINLENTLTFANAWKSIDSAVTQMKRLITSMTEINATIAIDFEELQTLLNEDIPKTIAFIQEAHKDRGPVTDENTEKEYTIEDLLGTLNAQLTEVRTLTISILKSCAEVEKLYAEGDALLESVLAAKTVVAAADESTIPVDARDAMLEQADVYYAKAKALYESRAKAECDFARAYNMKSSDSYVVDDAMDAKKIADAVLSEIKADIAYVEENALRRICSTLTETLETFDAEKIVEAGQLEEEVKDEGDEEVVVGNKYAVDNNLIALVTYGTRENNVKVAYKSFILNYNNFAVTVVHNNVTYTIPSGGYVMIQY